MADTAQIQEIPVVADYRILVNAIRDEVFINCDDDLEAVLTSPDKSDTPIPGNETIILQPTSTIKRWFSSAQTVITFENNVALRYTKGLNKDYLDGSLAEEQFKALGDSEFNIFVYRDFTSLVNSIGGLAKEYADKHNLKLKVKVRNFYPG
ncbi:MAG: hypothetical protein V3V78_03875 [Candidatus Woesearchaeota archaeon]